MKQGVIKQHGKCFIKLSDLLYEVQMSPNLLFWSDIKLFQIRCLECSYRRVFSQCEFVFSYHDKGWMLFSELDIFKGPLQ